MNQILGKINVFLRCGLKFRVPSIMKVEFCDYVPLCNLGLKSKYVNEYILQKDCIYVKYILFETSFLFWFEFVKAWALTALSL